jgi:hypothetical protein
MGSWKFMDIFGVPLMQMEDSLIQDLTTLRYLAEIAETNKRRETKPKGTK